MGVIHKLRADGSVLVLRAHVEQLPGYRAAKKPKERPHFEPNWAALAELDGPPAKRK